MIAVKIFSLFLLSPSNSGTVTKANIFFYLAIYQKKIPNSAIIATHICPDTESSEHFRKANIFYSTVQKHSALM